MALYDTTGYCNAGDQSTTGHYAVAKRPQNTAVVVGQIVRQFTAPAVGSERVFVCSQAGTTANTTDASWTLTRASATTDGTAKWIEATGQPALNGDVVNTISWTQAKAVIGALVNAGQIIKRNNGVSYQLCITQLVMAASEPAFSDVVGTTTAEGAGVWVCLGPVGNFTGGGAPHARLANACASTWFAAGNTVYVGDNHAESQATAITITPPGSTTLMSKIVCHDHLGSYPPTSSNLSAGAASVSTTTNTNITFNPSGLFYIYGLTFKAAVGVSTSSAFVIVGGTGVLYFDACSFWLSDTAANNTSSIQIGVSSSGSSVTIFQNCTVRFAVATNRIAPGYGQFIWQNTGPILASGSAVPSTLLVFAFASGTAYTATTLEALDLSQLTGALNSYNVTGSSGVFLVKDCKLNAAMTITTPATTGETIQLVRSSA